MTDGGIPLRGASHRTRLIVRLILFCFLPLLGIPFHIVFSNPFGHLCPTGGHACPPKLVTPSVEYNLLRGSLRGRGWETKQSCFVLIGNEMGGRGWETRLCGDWETKRLASSSLKTKCENESTRCIFLLQRGRSRIASSPSHVLPTTSSSRIPPKKVIQNRKRNSKVTAKFLHLRYDGHKSFQNISARPNFRKNGRLIAYIFLILRLAWETAGLHRTRRLPTTPYYI